MVLVTNRLFYLVEGSHNNTSVDQQPRHVHMSARAGHDQQGALLLNRTVKTVYYFRERTRSGHDTCTSSRRVGSPPRSSSSFTRPASPCLTALRSGVLCSCISRDNAKYMTK